MPAIADNFYATGRLCHGFAAALRDAPDTPPERLLQAIWQHQRLQRAQLRTLDGKDVRVLHPGFGNVEGGPDFRGAVLQLGDAPPTTGDVEVDVRPGGWRAHGHDRNPAFHNVILHVVWEAERAAGGPPTLVLRHVLDAPLVELSRQLEHASVRVLPDDLRGKCSAPLRELPELELIELLHQAARVRLENKAAHFRARAQQAGWEQSLWEGLFRALGYKHNVWPMQQLAELRERWSQSADSALVLQARLLGLAGLLPTEPGRRQSSTDTYLRQVWDCWWRERDAFADDILPRAVWRFHGLRPANHPQRRLALAAHWSCQAALAGRLEQWCASAVPDRELLPSLTQIFQVERDPYWSWHWTFRSVRLKKAQPLLGAPRVTDLAVNVVLPWLCARAGTGRNEKLAEVIVHRFHAWPAAEDNAVLRLARQRLLGRAMLRAGVWRRAAAQQGLLQIVRDYCDHAGATCEGCGFPELIRALLPENKFNSLSA